MTALEQLARDRVRNSSRALFKHGVGTASIGVAGAGVYALLEIARAIRSGPVDDKTRRLLAISDALVEAIVEGDEKTVKAIADAYVIERQDFGVDQLVGIPKLDAMQ